MECMRARQLEDSSSIERTDANHTDITMINCCLNLGSLNATASTKPSSPVAERKLGGGPRRSEVVTLAQTLPCGGVQANEILDGEAGETDGDDVQDAVNGAEK